MAWKPVVRAVSLGLKETGYAHIAVNDDHREITVTHTTHQNYDRIMSRQLGGGLVEERGVGIREPDLTPHHDLIVVCDVLNAAH